MKSGLYALAGASATATAAACANRLEPPMTKLSKLYLGLRRVSERRACSVELGVGTPLAAGAGLDSLGTSSSGLGSLDGPMPACWTSGFTTIAKLVMPCSPSMVLRAL